MAKSVDLRKLMSYKGIESAAISDGYLVFAFKDTSYRLAMVAEKRKTMIIYVYESGGLVKESPMHTKLALPEGIERIVIEDVTPEVIFEESPKR
ncbi:hypothetical protein HY639_06205 [Candidatus Woesearchaeota archaeon]|nr:hypothetical protein [Candidatus Woesearchaeota archaeon]